MLNKSQSISVRLSPEDYAYLMRIEQNGAMTQSEKVRELIHMTRDQVGPESFTRAYLSATETVSSYRALNKENPDKRSEIVDVMLDLVSEMAAAIQATEKNESFGLNLEHRIKPVAEALITRLLPNLLVTTNSQLSVQTNEIERRARLHHLIINLKNQIIQTTAKE